MGVGVKKPIITIEGLNLKDTALDATLLSMQAKDEAGLSNDYVILKFEDNGSFKRPARGTGITVFVGYEDTGTYSLGTYNVNKVEKTKETREKTITITCVSGSHNDKFKQSAKRSFKNATIKQIVDTIAAASNLESRVDPAIQNTVYTVIQNGETNQGFLRKLADNLDSIVKVASGRLYFGKRENTKKVDGSSIPKKTINEDPDMLTYTYTDDSISKYSGIKVKYYKGSEEVISTKVVGSNADAVKELPRTYKTEDEATKAGSAMLNKMARENQKLDFTSEGEMHIPAESRLTVVSNDADIAKDWIVTVANYEFTKGNLRVTYNCEGVVK